MRHTAALHSKASVSIKATTSRHTAVPKAQVCLKKTISMDTIAPAGLRYNEGTKKDPRLREGDNEQIKETCIAARLFKCYALAVSVRTSMLRRA